MTTPPDLGFLPFDRDSARPEDLRRVQRRPRQTTLDPAVLGAEPQAWPQEDEGAGSFHYIGQFIHAADLSAYCKEYYYGSEPPSYLVWHHTADPDASWAPYYSTPNKQWDRNESGMTLAQKIAKRKPQLDGIMRYYRDTLHWTVGPHWFVDELPGAWAFTPMYYIGIHCNEGNSYVKNGVTRYSIGVEVVGFYDRVVWPQPVRASAGWLSACIKGAIGFQNVYTSAPQDQPWMHDPQLSGHRDYTTSKTCPGLAITNQFFTQAAADGWSDYQAGTPPGPQPSDPLRARTIPGPPSERPYYCSVDTYDFYMARGGFAVLGYALADEVWTTGQNGQSCRVLWCERADLKDGRELALLSEVKAKGWVR